MIKLTRLRCGDALSGDALGMYARDGNALGKYALGEYALGKSPERSQRRWSQEIHRGIFAAIRNFRRNQRQRTSFTAAEIQKQFPNQKKPSPDVIIYENFNFFRHQVFCCLENRRR